MDALIPREQYAALDYGAYLNQASLGLIPRTSVTAMTSFITDVAQHGNLRMSDEAEAGVLDDLRAAAAQILDAPLRSVAVTGGASEGLSQAASLLATASGEVVLVPTDFPCVTYPWLSARDRLGMNVLWVQDQPDIDLTAALIDAITDSTTVVCCGAVQYATGTTVDVAAIADRAHQVGASVVIDATQMLGAAPVSMRNWHADVVVSSGYKWLSSHGGVALLAMSDNLIATTPQILGWKGTVDPFDFDAGRLRLADDARRFELSTMAYSSAVGLSASLALLGDVGIDAISQHARILATELIDSVAASGWRPFRPLDLAGASRHIISLVHDELDAHEIQRGLADDHRVFVSSRGGRIRVSLHGYNNSHDVEQLASALKRGS
jgi:cysteine desulfurase/selenocysteine lyase